MIQDIRKKTYNQPEIFCVELDNEISLVLASEPPTFESNILKNKENYKTDHFTNNLV